MRSIRLALIVYFLLLVTAALGSVSWFAYQATAHTLRQKQISAEKHIKSEYELECAKTNKEFDRKLLKRAQDVERHARGKRDLYDFSLPWLGAVGTGGQPQAPFAATLCFLAGQMPDARIYGRDALDRFLDVYHPVDIQIEFDEETYPLPERQTLFQTYTMLGKPLQTSASLEELRDRTPGLAEAFALPAQALKRAEAWRNRPRMPGPGPFDSEKRLAEERERTFYDEVELRPGIKVRRVTWIGWSGIYKYGMAPLAPAWMTGGAPFGRFRPNQGKEAKVPPPAKADKGPPARAFGGRNFILQYASEAITRDQATRLQALEDAYNDDVASQERESAQILAGLRTRFLLIFAATFLAVVAGGYWLVRLGLSPLQRLSDAVSRVSEKDFRLQVDGHLPAELQPIAARLTATLDQLKRAFGREKQAAADISHDLRTPLAALLANLEFALRKTRSAEEYQEILQECHASGSQMTQLVERLLALARLDAGVDNLRLREVDVANLAAQCADLVRPLAQARGLSVTLHADGPTTLKADPDKLREVLNNLLHNAIEYNKPDGSIAVAVGRDNGHLRLEVRDTGIGIAPEAREHIFERFYRVDPSRNADTLHAGIGLAIVKGYVDLMGGTIGVESGPAGSTFRVDFPVPTTA